MLQLVRHTGREDAPAVSAELLVERLFSLGQLSFVWILEHNLRSDSRRLCEHVQQLTLIPFHAASKSAISSMAFSLPLPFGG